MGESNYVHIRYNTAYKEFELDITGDEIAEYGDSKLIENCTEPEQVIDIIVEKLGKYLAKQDRPND